MMTLPTFVCEPARSACGGPIDLAHRRRAEGKILVGGVLADRQPTVYRRYTRWWKTIPSAEVRLLPS